MRNIIKQLSTIHEAIFPKKEKILQESIPKETINPYVAARYEWNVMFGDIIVAKQNWQRIAFILGVINVALVMGMVTVSLQKRFIPYAVKVDSLGNANFSGLLTQQNTIQPMMVNAMLRRYIMEARSVIADPIAQKHQLDFVYRSTIDEASTILDNFYQSRNPFDRVKDETIDVTVNSVLAKSINTWQVHWTEIHRDTTGHIQQQNHFEALMTITHRTPTTMEDININPLGLYVSHLSWGSQQ